MQLRQGINGEEDLSILNALGVVQEDRVAMIYGNRQDLIRFSQFDEPNA